MAEVTHQTTVNIRAAGIQYQLLLHGLSAHTTLDFKKRIVWSI